MAAHEIMKSVLKDLAELDFYYRFEETSGTTVNDSSGNANNAVASRSNILNNPGGLYGNKAVFVAASSDKITLTNPTALNGLSKLSIAFWAKPTTLTANTGFVNRSTGGSNNQFTFGSQNNDTVQFSIATSPSDWFGTYATAPAGTIDISGLWRHYVLVYDGTASGNANRLKFYFDGALQPLTFNGTIPATLTTITQDLIIAQRASAEAGSYYNGEMDDFAILPAYALSAEQVKELSQGRLIGELWNQSNLLSLWPFYGSSVDLGPGGRNGTDTAMTYSADKFGKAAVFNGSSSRIVLANDVFSNANIATGSIPFWFKRSATPGATEVLFDIEGWLRIDINISGQIGAFTDGNNTYARVTPNFCDNLWHFCEVTWTSNSTILYIDGVERASAVALNAPTPDSTAGRASTFGSVYTGSTSLYAGRLDAFSALSRVRTPQEIRKWYAWASGKLL